MEKLKKNIKSFLNWVPFGLGKRLLLPFLVYIITYIPWHQMLYRLACLLEARRIKAALKNENYKDFIFVFDDNASVFAFGEFLSFLMLARYVQAKERNIRIFIVEKADTPQYFSCYSDTEPVKAFISERIGLINSILNIGTLEVNQIEWDKFIENSKFSSKTDYFIFKDKVLNGESIYNYCFNTLSVLIKNESKTFQDRVLLTKTNFISFRLNDILLSSARNYIAVACRYNINWRLKSNTEPREFCEIITTIKKEFPNFDILIMSDRIGCEYFKQLADKNNFNCIFSDDVLPGFLASVVMVLNSKFYVQFKGGGLALAAIYSRTPYFINAIASHEIMASRNKISTWADDRQIYVNTNESSITMLEKFLLEVEEID